MDYVREAKDFLRNYRDYTISLENMKHRLQELETELEGYKPTSYSGMPSGSGGDDEVDDRLCNLIFARDRTSQQLVETQEIVDKYEAIVDNLKDEYKKILVLSFIEEKPDILIMDELFLSRTSYFRKKGEAIRCFARQLHGIKASGY